MKKSLLLTVLLLIAFTSFSQVHQLEPDQHKGEIILKKGAARKGYVDLKGSDMSPWANQNSVQFFTEEALADGKVKGKEMEKFKPKDIEGYMADDRYFESVKISAAKLSLGFGLSEQKFVERLVDGKVKLYKLYEEPDPAGVYVGEEAIAAHEQELERMRNEPMLVLRKGEGDFTLVSKVNLSEFLADCPSVVQKYESGGYGIEPWNKDAKTKLGKMIANNANASMMEGVLHEILNDYNQCAGK